MNQEKLQDAIGLLEDDLIEEVDRLRQERDREKNFTDISSLTENKPSSISKLSRHRKFVRWGSLAASLCVLVGASYFWAMGGLKNTDDSAMDHFFISAEKEEAQNMEIYPGQEAPVVSDEANSAAGSKAPETAETTSKDTQEMKPTDSAVEPPSLLLLTAATEQTTGAGIPGTRGGYHWTFENEDGTTTATIADSPHPLLWEDFINRFQTTDPTVAMKFTNAPGTPESITVQCWNEKHWGDVNAESEMLISFATDLTLTKPTLTLKEGTYIYLVTVQWDRGSVDYAFCATYERSTP